MAANDVSEVIPLDLLIHNLNGATIIRTMFLEAGVKQR